MAGGIARPIDGSPSLAPGPPFVRLSLLESLLLGAPTMLSGRGILFALGPPVGGNRGILVALAPLGSVEYPGVEVAPPKATLFTGLDSLDLDLAASANEVPLLARDREWP
jgi:hypothetical protein